MSWCHVVNLTTGASLARARLAGSFVRRLLGLLGRRSLDPGEGLLLGPTRGVHTLGMRFAVDAVYLDAQGCVLTVVTLPPGRLGPLVPSCRWVLELAAGGAGATCAGHQIVVYPV
ncbi:MAG TPA: DUF192 domain-containing protein [Clostridiales bacterium UBA8153]|nr:DUF192 domain-containing protein [Clostridiales bacterium UBA8153]